MFYQKESLLKFSNNNAVIYYHKNGTQQNILYKDLIAPADKVADFLRKDLPTNNNTIGIVSDHDLVIVPLVLGILNSSNAFCFLSPTKELELLDVLESNRVFYFITKNSYEFTNKKVLFVANIVIFNYVLKFWKIHKSDNNIELIKDIWYCVSTSGSTGESKFVRVPSQCIIPNIEKLKNDIFIITSSDIIFTASPPTFDPFIVDLLLTLSSGACIIFTNNVIRQSHHHLIKFLFDKNKNGATIMQCTPSYFQQWNINEINENILSDQSSLRVLSLGGEPFPSKLETNRWKKTNKIIYNIYGITEVSCWNMIEKVHLNAIEEISLGKCIDEETILQLRCCESRQIISEGVGELFIGSTTRICQIDNETPLTIPADLPLFRETGDLVEFKSKKYFFRSRLNENIKRYGVKINLRRIENQIAKRFANEIENIKLIFMEQNMQLILFYVLKSLPNTTPLNLGDLWLFINKNLTNSEMPNAIHKLDKFPLSCHGKISTIKLTELYEQIRYSDKRRVREIFVDSIANFCGIQIEDYYKETLYQSEHNLKRLKSEYFTSFLDLGGNSFKALNLVMLIEDKLKKSVPQLITMLLDNTYTLKDIIAYLEQYEDNTFGAANKSDVNLIITSTIKNKYNFEKCVDSNPSIFEINKRYILSVGSHSSVLQNIDLDTNTIVSTLKLPDRIESQVSQYNIYNGIVGCYDEFLYCFEILTGTIIWKFNTNGMIKCKPLVIEEFNIILCGNYNSIQNFWCINGKSGEFCYSKLIGEKSIISNPIIFYDIFAIVCTLDGSCCLIDITNGNIIWIIKFGTPIFSNSINLKNVRVLVAEVGGTIHCLDAKGNNLWTVDIPGNLFSSFSSLEFHNKYQIYFGSHNKKLYCLEVDVLNDCCNIKWETNELRSQIYSTPKIIKLKNNQMYLIVCSTQGEIYFFDLHENTIYSQMKLDGDIFSTPNVYQNRIIVGCRDNFVYDIEYVLK